MQNQQPYPMPEIRIQMRLNIITDAGELSMGPNGQMQFVQPPPTLPAIKSTPTIQQIDSSGDERKHRHRKHKHSSRDKEARHSTSRSRNRDNRSHRSRRDREGPSESDISTSTVTNVSQQVESQDLPYVVNEPTPSSSDFGQFGMPGPAIRPSSQANFSDLEPLDNELPQEISFNENLINPPVIISQEQTRSNTVTTPRKENNNGLQQGAPSVHRPGHYRTHQKGLPDESLDSLEVSLDNRFAAFQERLSASNPDLNAMLKPVPFANGSRVQIASNDDSRNRPPSVSSQHTLIDDTNLGPAPGGLSGSLSGTVKSLLSALDVSAPAKQPFPAPRSQAGQVDSEQPINNLQTKPIPKPRQFGSFHSLHSENAEFEQPKRSNSHKSLETTFPAEELTSTARPPSPSISLHSSNFSYPEFTRPGILKKSAVPVPIPIKNPPAETTFGPEPDILPEAAPGSTAGSRPVTPGRSREEIEQELAPLLSNIEGRMRGLFSDQDNALKSTIGELTRRVDEAKNKEAAAVREEEIKSYFHNLEVKLSNMIAEREKSLSSTIQSVVQTSALQSKVDALEKESQVKFLEQRLEHLFTEKEAAFRSTVESLVKEIAKAQPAKSPSPPPAPEPKPVPEQLIRDQLSPTHYVQSQPYAASNRGAEMPRREKAPVRPKEPELPPKPQSPPGLQEALNYSVDSDWSQNRMSFYDVPTPVKAQSPLSPNHTNVNMYEVPSDAKASLYNVPSVSIPRPSNFERKAPHTQPLTTVTETAPRAKPEYSPSTSSSSQKPINKASSQRIFDLYTRRLPPTKKHGDSLSSNLTDSTLMEENLEDYLLKGDHFSPPTLAVPESASLSREDSLSSETSLRADRSAPFFDVKTVRFREDFSDIESKLRQERGSVASTATTFSDVGIPLMTGEMADSPRKRYAFEETTVVEQVEYFRTGKNVPPPAPFDLYRSDSSASTNTISGYGQAEVDASRVAKTVFRPDSIALLGHLAQSNTVGAGRQPTAPGKSPTKPTDL